MGVHSFRLSAEEERRFRSLGVPPSARAKALLVDELRRRQVHEDLEWLRRHAVKARVPSVRIIREGREELDRRTRGRRKLPRQARAR